MISYFLVVGDERKGPFSREQIVIFYKNLKINNSSLIWREGLENWVQFQDLEEFNFLHLPKKTSSGNKKIKEEKTGINQKSNVNQKLKYEIVNKSDDGILLLLLAIPIAFLAAFFLRATFFKWVMWISSMWVHEFGHSISGWLSGRFMFPVPFLATFGSPIFNALGIMASFIVIFLGVKHSRKALLYVGGWLALFFASYYFGDKSKIIIYLLFLLFLLTLLKISKIYDLKVLYYLGVALLFLQAYMTFFIDAKSWDMIMRFSGIGGEFVIGALLVVSFYYKFPEDIRWDFFRYIFLIIGAYCLLAASLDWYGYASNQSLMPFGTALAGSSDPHGDLNFLRDKYGWSEAIIVKRYLFLSKLCLGLVISHYFFFLYKGLKRKS